MSVNYNIPTINARLSDVIDSIDAGSSVGKLRLMGTISTDTVALIPFQKPCGSVAAGVLTFSILPNAATILLNTSSNNPLANADIEDSAGTVVVSGLTVGVSSAYDIVIATTTVLAGRTITLTSATITGV